LSEVIVQKVTHFYGLWCMYSFLSDVISVEWDNQSGT